MQTIADNLQILVDHKQAVKQSLINHKKEPTDKIATYAGLIDELENPDDVTYLVTVDGENTAYTVLHGQEKVELNATPNDVRVGTKVIAENGVMDGEKNIPSYHSRYGTKMALAGTEAIIDVPDYDYKDLMVTITPFNSSISDSVSVEYASVDNSMYKSKTTEKIADITVDAENEQVKLGITVNVLSVIRYFIVREEI